MSWLSKWFGKARKWVTWKRLKPPLTPDLQQDLNDIVDALREVVEDAVKRAIKFFIDGDLEKIEEFFRNELKRVLGNLDDLDDKARDFLLKMLWAIGREYVLDYLKKIADERPQPED